MKNISLNSTYQNLILKKKYKLDIDQKIVVSYLEDLYCFFNKKNINKFNFLQFFYYKYIKKLNKNKFFNKNITKSLYIWGGTGRGKTWLMDLFYKNISSKRKLRIHFNRFMLKIHEELTLLQGKKNPLDIIVDKLKQKIDLICFDEFFITDITDAMLLGYLIQSLLIKDIILVITSNIKPDNLYLNGLNREKFLPVIKTINKYCNVINIGNKIDYRYRFLKKNSMWFFPIEDKTNINMNNIFKKLSGECYNLNNNSKSIKVNHRLIKFLNMKNGVISFDFSELCNQVRNKSDYIVISKQFHCILIYNVKQMGFYEEDIANKFLILIDELYERKVKLIVNSNVPIKLIYQGKKFNFEFKRCLSRLYEMQSNYYFSLTHNP